MGIEANADGNYPRIASSAVLHPTATVIGCVSIGDNVFIGPHAVIRADEPGPDGTVQPIVISDGANVQDCVVIHAIGGSGVTIGRRTSIAHSAIIHGPCQIGAGCFVGFNSVVFRATLGDEAVVLHHALVEGAEVPRRKLVPSMTAVRGDQDIGRLEPLTAEVEAFVQRVSRANLRLVANVQTSPTQTR